MGSRREQVLQAGDTLNLGPAQASILFTGEEVRARIREMAASLRERLGDECPVFVGLLHAGFVFLADLIRAFDAPHEIDFLKVSRYDPAHREPTAVRVLMDLRGEVRGRTVVVVEAIRAQGTKIEYVERFLRLRGPRRILYCALVVPEQANRAVPIDEVGFVLRSRVGGRTAGGAAAIETPGAVIGSAGAAFATAGTGSAGPASAEPGQYVIGYGLDYRERYRHLDCIATLAMPPEEPVFARGVA